MNGSGWVGMALAGLAMGTVRAAGIAGSGALVAEAPLERERLVAARLPAALLAAADDDLRNVWVEDDAGGRVPAAIEPVLAAYPFHTHVAGVADGWQVIDLAAGGVPLSRLSLRTPAAPFSRRFTLHGLSPDNGKVAETPIAEGALTQDSSQGGEAARLTVSFAPHRFEVYRLRLEAVEGAGPDAEVAAAEGPAWQVVVPMRPDRRYTIRAGGAAPAAGGDAGPAAVAARRAEGAETVPGRIDGFVPEVKTPAHVLGRSPLLLMAMLVAGGLLLWRLLRRAKRMG